MGIKNFIEGFYEQFDFSGVKKIKNKYFYKPLRKDALYSGIYLGEDYKKFQPSLALLEMLGKVSRKKAIVNRKAEWLFICRRDIMESSIVKMNDKEGLILVHNENDENLGYGIIKKENGTLIIKNLLDKGDFLRRERRH